ncbi:c-type cytochrome domain-containing protein [Chitinophaga vietnamensis]|uniref:c-type cytochrome domain-containing protein n=1 Tax=Chitinophaga vietnamensis TaxID=2593957 RepID=UPI0013760BD5|nr:c-type cytochrome domain-containing protein [Chitinophaga vietnamensis]
MSSLYLLLDTARGSWRLLAGRSHPLVVHLPIGMLIMAAVLIWLSRKRPSLKPAIRIVLLLSALSAVYSCIAGYLLSLDGGYDERLLSTHMWLGIGVALSSIVLLLAEMLPPLHRFRLPLAVLMLLLLSAAGHYGGSLTHGDDYLSQAMPPALQRFSHASVQANAAAYTNIEDARLYEDLVRPVLTNRCYGCHNEQKLKGGLRLESVALIRKGGEHGPVLKDSLPEESELFKRLLLSENDEHRMPPKGKPGLTPQELELLYWWISQGAPQGKAVKDLPKTPRILAVLAGMQPARALDHNEFVPTATVSAASAQHIQALEQKGVKVLPVADGSPMLQVSCINAAAFSDQDAPLLAGIRSQVIWLDLSGTKVTDHIFTTLAQMPQLTRLEMKNTSINGSGLAKLNSCTELRYLNLNGVKINAAALAALQQNKKLQQLYLYQTGITSATTADLQRALPKLAIDTGGYKVEQLASDTIIYHKI